MYCYISLVFAAAFLFLKGPVNRSDEDKVDSFITKESGSAVKTEGVDSDHHFSDQEYDLCRNGVHYNDTLNDLSDYNNFEQLSVDHQLKLTLDNLKQIHIAVEGKKSEFFIKSYQLNLYSR